MTENKEIKKETLELSDLYQNNESVSQELVQLKLDHLSQNIQNDSFSNFEKQKDDLDRKFKTMQTDIDAMIPNTMNGMNAEAFRKKWEAFGKMSPDDQKKFLADPTEKQFIDSTKELMTQIEEYVKDYQPSEMNFFLKKGVAIEETFTKSLEHPIELNGAYLGLAGLYLSTWTTDKNKGPMKMFKMAGILGAAGLFPTVTATVLRVAEAGLETLGKGVRVAGKVGINTFTFLSRGGDSAEFLWDGKWKSRRTQEMIRDHRETLDKDSRDFVPEIINPWYSKIIDPKGEKLKDQEILAASEYCVKSLDKNAFFSPEEFDVIGKKMKAGEWNKIPMQEYWRMLNTAYATRTMEYFLKLPKTDIERILFEKQFTTLFAQKKAEQTKLNLEAMYGEKINKEIEKKQSFGVAAEINNGGLKSILTFIAMLYAAVIGVMGASHLIQKKREKTEKEKEVKNKDHLDDEEMKKLKEEFFSKKKTKENVKNVLAILVGSGIISASVEKELKDTTPDRFFECLDPGDQTKPSFFKDLENKSISECYTNFKTCISGLSEADLGGGKISVLNEKLDAAELASNYSSLEKRLEEKENTVTDFYVYALDPKDKNKEKLFILNSLKRNGGRSGNLDFTATFENKEKLKFNLNKSGDGRVEFTVAKNISDNPKVNKGGKYEVKRLSFSKLNVGDAEEVGKSS